MQSPQQETEAANWQANKHHCNESPEARARGPGSVTDLIAGAHTSTDLLGLIPELQPLLAQMVRG